VTELEVSPKRLAASSTTTAGAAIVSENLWECCRERERRQRVLLAERDALRNALKTANEVRRRRKAGFMGHFNHHSIVTLLGTFYEGDRAGN